MLDYIKLLIKKSLSFATFFFNKIFIRPNSKNIQEPFFNNLSNYAHSFFIYTLPFSYYLAIFDTYLFSKSINLYIFTLLFFQILITVRYINPLLLQEKKTQIDIVLKINKVSLLIFIGHWLLFSFWLAFVFLLITFLFNIIYISILKIGKHNTQDEYSPHFHNNYHFKKHLNILFESPFNIEDLTLPILKKQFRKMAKKYHPDVNNANSDKFIEIKKSYDFLKSYIDTA